jgi:hypothetical protein
VAARRAAAAQQSGRRALSVRSQASAAAAATADDIAALNAKFGIPGRVEVVAGRGDLPTVVLTHACGASAEVTLFGGVITSFKQASGDEVLYIRPDAVFDKSKPISGGIPHCFPQASQLDSQLDRLQNLFSSHTPALQAVLCRQPPATGCMCPATSGFRRTECSSQHYSPCLRLPTCPSTPRPAVWAGRDAAARLCPQP